MGHRQTNPLKAEKLISFADPQRMIQAGARAVDGWVNENGFTVLLCSAGGQSGYCQFSAHMAEAG